MEIRESREIRENRFSFVVITMMKNSMYTIKVPSESLDNNKK